MSYLGTRGSAHVHHLLGLSLITFRVPAEYDGLLCGGVLLGGTEAEAC